ncbi:hypothetical protein OPV22_011282 [Ensete ventricosum]|uniref:Phosphatase PP2A regulatory subunit A/Splicing factor 3B subunit 1-like HEAT repeat domain-containing protein n=1 Tax=Ensete ventricosum TaxID=4639 RepID=A0AAV8RFB9_ENSVE|nr:hypothetical protein OPV22_011282 [Ensete ventricosum]
MYGTREVRRRRSSGGRVWRLFKWKPNHLISTLKEVKDGHKGHMVAVWRQSEWQRQWRVIAKVAEDTVEGIKSTRNHRSCSGAYTSCLWDSVLTILSSVPKSIFKCDLHQNSIARFLGPILSRLRRTDTWKNRSCNDISYNAKANRCYPMVPYQQKLQHPTHNLANFGRQKLLWFSERCLTSCVIGFERRKKPWRSEGPQPHAMLQNMRAASGLADTKCQRKGNKYAFPFQNILRHKPPVGFIRPSSFKGFPIAMAMIDEPLYPIAILIDELKNEDIQLRLNSIRRLSTIARALGEERTRKELIPFLSENNDDDDEVLLAMAEELGVFVPYVGGVEYAHVLLPPLETLCIVEETCVRDKAVESLCRIGAQMKESDIVEWFIPLVKRLAGGEWFTARVSSCGLFHIAYPSATELLKAELRSMYGQLCQDDMPMVRRSAASNLGKFAATVEANNLKTDIMSIFEDLTQDDQDSVRLLAVEGCAALGKLLEPQDCVAHILPLIVNFSQDKSWRVRYMVANQLYELCEAVGPEPTCSDLVPAYVRLLRDNEAEVRIAAAGKVTKFCRILNPHLAIQHILPCVKELSSDSSQHVRSALASVIMGMAPVLGKDATIEELLPIFLSLLKDEFPDVRLNIISKLDQVNQVIGIDLLSQSLLPAIVELAEDRHWRVRLAIIEYIPLLASQFGVGFFNDKLGALCMQWLEDKVFSIREAAANNLKRLAEEFGPEWAMHNIVPQLMEKISNPHYLHRMTILQSISLLAPVLGSESTYQKLLPVIITASKDRVPNIKFNVAKVLQSLIPIFDHSVVEQTVRPCLVELSEDPDVDVRYFASQAIQTCDSVMMSS